MVIVIKGGQIRLEDRFVVLCALEDSNVFPITITCLILTILTQKERAALIEPPSPRLFPVVIITVSMASCSEAADSDDARLVDSKNQDLPVLTVYKSPTCKCCAMWMVHLKENQFKTAVQNSSNLSVIKKQK